MASYVPHRSSFYQTSSARLPSPSVLQRENSPTSTVVVGPAMNLRTTAMVSQSTSFRPCVFGRFYAEQTIELSAHKKHKFFHRALRRIYVLFGFGGHVSRPTSCFSQTVWICWRALHRFCNPHGITTVSKEAVLSFLSSLVHNQDMQLSIVSVHLANLPDPLLYG